VNDCFFIYLIDDYVGLHLHIYTRANFIDICVGFY